jgi:hypothetical protein
MFINQELLPNYIANQVKEWDGLMTTLRRAVVHLQVILYENS